jgi:hypothetical protein
MDRGNIGLDTNLMILLSRRITIYIFGTKKYKYFLRYVSLFFNSTFAKAFPQCGMLLDIAEVEHPEHPNAHAYHVTTKDLHLDDF